jgi:Na+-transporting NADH:ubiquinone oxidoreductase subunit NqrF
MTINQIREILTAFEAGKNIQCKSGDNWVDIPQPSWNFGGVEYRVKPEPREWWVNMYLANAHTYSSERLAKAYVLPDLIERVHVREVL